MKIVADSAIPFLRGLLEEWAEVAYVPGAAITPKAVQGADALVVRTRTRCDERLLHGSAVQLVATATIGADHIDIPWCTRHGIDVVTAAGCNARGVLQWMGAALAWLCERQGWQPRQTTLGVVGVGHVGSLVEEYGRAWGFRVLCCDPPRERHEHCGFLPLETLAREADILTFHVPLDSATRHIAGAALFAQMKPSAVVVNASRGGVVDSAALLRSGLQYVLDVYENEPTPDPALLARALLATPHVAGYSEQGKAMATAMAVRALARRFGLPLEGWYPPQAAAPAPRAITWQELCTTIGGAYDIEAESLRLKARPEEFEQMRDSYNYRREYF